MSDTTFSSHFQRSPREYLRSPREASKALWPKQRSTFLVKFYPNGVQAGADQQVNQNLSYVAKMMDRPKISPKVEELHQYNKRRLVYTGFKGDPVRIQFYDDVLNSAMKMWNTYAQYYFNDFQNIGDAYRNDIVSKQFVNKGGFITQQNYPAPAQDAESNYFFQKIELYHFYLGMYDAYQLINPRITVFDADDVDYENYSPSLISMTFTYENLQYVLQRSAGSGDTTQQPFSEFAQGAPFNGDVIQVNSISPRPDTSDMPWYNPSSATPVDNLLASAQGTLSNPSNYRYNGQSATGALGMFGDFQFGPNSTGNLANMALNSIGLSAALDMGTRVDPLTVMRHSLQGFVNTAVRRGIDGAAWDVAAARTQPYLSGYGNAGGTVASALLATGDGASVPFTPTQGAAPPQGVVLSPETYGVLNSQQAGTAQYGYRTDSLPMVTAAIRGYDPSYSPFY